MDKPLVPNKIHINEETQALAKVAASITAIINIQDTVGRELYNDSAARGQRLKTFAAAYWFGGIDFWSRYRMAHFAQPAQTHPKSEKDRRISCFWQYRSTSNGALTGRTWFAGNIVQHYVCEHQQSPFGSSCQNHACRNCCTGSQPCPHRSCAPARIPLAKSRRNIARNATVSKGRPDDATRYRTPRYDWSALRGLQ